MKERKIRLGTRFPGCVVSKFRKKLWSTAKS